MKMLLIFIHKRIKFIFWSIDWMLNLTKYRGDKGIFFKSKLKINYLPFMFPCSCVRIIYSCELCIKFNKFRWIRFTLFDTMLYTKGLKCKFWNDEEFQIELSIFFMFIKQEIRLLPQNFTIPPYQTVRDSDKFPNLMDNHNKPAISAHGSPAQCQIDSMKLCALVSLSKNDPSPHLFLSITVCLMPAGARVSISVGGVVPPI